MRRLIGLCVTLLSIVVLPSAALAQAVITGAVKDTSGAVLPGVSVEATSPVLIEKVRSSVTDGAGQYRIEEFGPAPTPSRSRCLALRRSGAKALS